MKKLAHPLSFLLAASMLVVASMVWHGCSGLMPSDADGLYKKGIKELKAWNYAAADSTFQVLQSKFPESPLGQLGKGMTKEAQLLHYDALDIYSRLNVLTPRPKELAPQLAALFLKLGDYEQAWRTLSDYIPANSKDIDALLTYIEGLIQVNRLSQARQALQIAQSNGLSEIEAAGTTARILFLQRSLDSADLFLTKARRTPISTARYYRTLARYYEQTEQYDSAIAAGARAFDLSKGDLNYLLEHVQRSLRSGYQFAAREAIVKGESFDRDSMVTTGLWMFYYWTVPDGFRANRMNDRFFARASEEMTGYFYDIESRWMLSDLLSCNTNIDALNAMLARRGSNPWMISYLRGRLVLAYSRIFEPQTDIASLRASPGYKNDQIEYRTLEAEQLAMSKQDTLFVETMDLLDQYRGADPNWVVAIGSVYAGRWRQDLATGGRYFKKALEIDSLHRGAFEGYLATQSSQFGFDSALALFDTYPRMTEIYPSLGVSKALTLLLTKKPDQAVEQFTKSIKPMAGRLAIYLQFAALAESEGDQQVSAKVLELMLANNPSNPDGYAIAARTANNREDFTAALQLADKALSLDATLPQARTEKARALVGSGNHSAGIAMYEEIIKETDGDVEANLYYSAALTHDSTNIDNMIKAGNMARNAHFLDRASLRSLLNLCYVYSRDGKYDGVRAEASKAINAYPGSPEAHYYLGMALHRLKDAQATELLRHAIKIGLKGKLKAEAELLLAGE